MSAGRPRWTTIDAHAAGGSVRLITEGYPSPRGDTMAEKRRWAMRHANAARRTLLLPPRGDVDLTGAVLTAPVSPGAHAGLLFLTGDGHPMLSGHTVIAVTTIALDRGLIVPGGDGLHVVYDTPAGTVRARARRGGAPDDEQVEPFPHLVAPDAEVPAPSIAGVTVALPPSFVLAGGVPLTCGPRRIRADIACSGGFFAVVDAESVGVSIDVPRVPELRRAGIEIARAAAAAVTTAHPSDQAMNGVRGTVFTGPSLEGRADLRVLMVTMDGAIDRSPSATGTAAVMAVLDAMGLIVEGQPFTSEGIFGTRFTSRIASRTAVAEQAALVVEIEGRAWVTGEHRWMVQGGDPLIDGRRFC